MVVVVVAAVAVVNVPAKVDAPLLLFFIALVVATVFVCRLEGRGPVGANPIRRTAMNPPLYGTNMI